MTIIKRMIGSVIEWIMPKWETFEWTEGMYYLMRRGAVDFVITEPDQEVKIKTKGWFE